MTHPNETLVRKGYEAVEHGDVATIKEVLADDIVFHVPGRAPTSGEYRGRDAVLGFFMKGQELTGGTLRFEIHDVAATDEHAIVLQTNRARRNGKTLQARNVTVFHLRDGQAVEAWVFTDSQYENDEFWS